MRDELEAYQSLNRSFKTNFVLRFGDQSGFYSELNNLVLAALYCLHHRISISLYTPHRRATTIRWNDYFLPFCGETDRRLHRILNFRPLDTPSFRTWRFWSSLKPLHGASFVTQDLWRQFRSPSFATTHFSVPEIGLSGDLVASSRKLVETYIRYSASTRTEIETARAGIELPKPYVGLHVRAGDKADEADLFGVDRYMTSLLERTSLTRVFVLTDDYRCVTELRRRYPTHTFTTLCREEERGYRFDEFLALGPEPRRREYIKLLASIEAMCSAELTVGTRSSNPGMYLGMRMGDRFVGIDHPDWLIW